MYPREQWRNLELAEEDYLNKYKPLIYKELMRDSFWDNEESRLVRMEEVYADYKSYKRWLIKWAREQGLRLNKYEQVTASINLYNDIILEEIQKTPLNWDEDLLAIFCYKLGYLLARYKKRTSERESHIIGINILLTLLINFSRGVYMENPAIYIGSILRFKFLDLLDPNYAFKRVGGEPLEYNSDKTFRLAVSEPFESLSYQYLALREETISIFHNSLGRALRMIRYKESSERYKRIKEDMILNYIRILREGELLKNFLDISSLEVEIYSSKEEDAEYLELMMRIMLIEIRDSLTELYRS